MSFVPKRFARVHLARVREELAELYASSKLCLTRFSKVYSAKLSEGLAELDSSSEPYPKKICKSTLSQS